MSNAKARLKAGIRRARHLLPRRPRPAILMYHRIARESFDPWGLVVERNRFAAQIEWLARERAVLPLTEFARLHQKRKLAANAVSLTFDDGYASVLDAVAPLEKHGWRPAVRAPCPRPRQPVAARFPPEHAAPEAFPVALVEASRDAAGRTRSGDGAATRAG